MPDRPALLGPTGYGSHGKFGRNSRRLCSFPLPQICHLANLS